MPSNSETAAPKHGDIRYDKTGPIKAMAYADGYVMVRRPYCAPWVISRKDWDKLGDANVIGRSDAPRAMSYGVPRDKWSGTQSISWMSPMPDESKTAVAPLDKIRAKAYHWHPDYPVTAAEVDWLLDEIDRLRTALSRISVMPNSGMAVTFAKKALSLGVIDAE